MTRSNTARISVGPSGPRLLSGHVAENVLLGRSDIGDLEIYKALEASGALAWVRRQPLGLDTPVGERGAGLSSGQRQTLALARAFAGAPAFLVLDEPSSDLDMASEAALVGRLKILPQTTTLLLVTHRPALLEAVNRIVVLEGGKILLDGPREEVLQRLKGVVEERRQSTQTVSLQVSA
ncbi:MAG: ATP-binding cassette domain-containing protein [Nitratireductor sp.]